MRKWKLRFRVPLSESSHGFVMSSYILFAHLLVHAAPVDVALRVITSAERAPFVHGYCCTGMYGTRH